MGKEECSVATALRFPTLLGCERHLCLQAAVGLPLLPCSEVGSQLASLGLIFHKERGFLKLAEVLGI